MSSLRSRIDGKPVKDDVMLFALPYAGGSAAIYSRWKRKLEPPIEVAPLELAGRGTRFGELPYGNLESAVEDIYLRLTSAAGDRPYAIFGHSMGGLLAFELAHQLQARHFRAPEHLFLSGMSLPTTARRRRFSDLSDERLLEELLLLGATSSEAAGNQEWIDLFLPIIRSDFSMMENRILPGGYPPLSARISILSGSGDFTTDRADQEEWSRLCGTDCILHSIPGGHFFIHNEEDAVLRLVQRILDHAMA